MEAYYTLISGEYIFMPINYIIVISYWFQNTKGDSSSGNRGNTRVFH